MFDAGAVVPAAVENHDLAAGREMRDVALQEDLGLLPVGWRWQGDHAEHPRAYFLGESFDGAALAGGIAALEQDDNPELFRLDPFLQMAELYLQFAQLLLIRLPFLLGARFLPRHPSSFPFFSIPPSPPSPP